MTLSPDEVKQIVDGVKAAQCMDHSGHVARIENVENGLKDHIATHWKFYTAVVATAGVVVAIVGLVT